MKRLLLFIALVSVAHAAGTVQQNLQNVGSNVFAFSFNWTGDSVTGSVPATTAQGSLQLQGYRVISIETTPGSPAPTNGYSITLIDTAGVDIMAGAAASLSSTSGQSFAGSPTAPPLYGSFAFTVTGNSVASAKGSAVVYLAPLNQVLGLSPTSPSFPAQGANLIYASPNGASGSPGFRSLAIPGDFPAQGAPDTKIQLAGTNSGTSGAALCNDANGGATTSGCTPALPSGSQLQYLRIQPNTGNSTTNQFAALPVINVNDYNFPSYSCNGPLTCVQGGSSAGSLAVGNNTLTFTPVPLGVNGVVGVSGAGPYLYVSGGTGTAEACLINGGTGVSGSASGTIIINCANTHTGAWTVQSATAGIQEAANITNGIYLPDGTYNTFAPVVFNGDATITCASNHAIIQGNSATQNMFVSITSTLSQRFRVTGCNLTTSVTKTAGDGIQLNGTGSTVNRSPVIDNVMLQGQWNGIHAVSAAYVTITNCRVILGVNFDVWIQDTFHTDSGDQVIATSSFDNSVNTGTVIRYESGGGLKVLGNKIQNHAVGLDMEIPDGVTNTGQLVVVGNSFDGLFTSSAINLQRAASTGQFFDIDITGNYIGGNGTTPNCLSVGNGINGVQITGNYFKNCVTAINLTGNATSIGIQANYTNATISTGVSVASTVATVRASDNNWNVASACFSLAAPVLIQDRTSCFVFSNLPTTNAANGSEVFCFDCNPYCTAGSGGGANCFRQGATWVPAPAAVLLVNYISTETGAANAIAGTLTGVPLTIGLRVTQALAHTLQAGANTYAYNGGAAVAIKSSRNTANNIATAYAAAGSISLVYDGTQWEDESQ